MALAECLKINTSITQINLNRNRIEAEGSAFLATSLSVNNTLNLDKCDFPDFNDKECLKLLNLSDDFSNKSNKDIVTYLREMSTSGSITVHRTRLFLVGSGRAGKTTLVRKLTSNTFVENFRQMTDGIAMSELRVDEIEFRVYDFAGQKEYMHTHRLFFQEDTAVFIAVYRPDSTEDDRRDLELFLEMVYDCAPSAEVILVTTFADGDSSVRQRALSDDEIKTIRDRNPHTNIVKVIAVDCRTGRGTDDVKLALRDVALRLPKIRNEIPNSFNSLEMLLKSLTNKNDPKFSISNAEFFLLATEQVKMKDDIASLAHDLFCSWGIVHQLSNGDVVLQVSITTTVTIIFI